MKHLVRWVVIAVVVNGTAWAQTQTEDELKRALQTQTLNVVCGVPRETFYQMSAAQQTKQCEKTNTVQVKESFSTTLGIIGVLTSISGLSMILPMGEEYHILGDTYCVLNDGHDVNYGGCGSEVKKIGAIVLGSGALMTWIGVRKVTKTKRIAVAPHLSPTSQAVRATVTW